MNYAAPRAPCAKGENRNKMVRSQRHTPSGNRSEHRLSPVPAIRIRSFNGAAPRPGGEFVLYWMTAFRRTRWNFALDRAVEWAQRMRKPLVVFEALRCDYPWASDRFHAFILQGMAENARRVAGRSALYFPYVEADRGSARGLLAALAGRSCVVVTDDFPGFFLPDMISAAARDCPVPIEAVDSNGLLPLRSAPRVFETAHAFRRFLQSVLPAHLHEFPARDPLRKLSLPVLKSLPREILRRWPAAPPKLLSGASRELSILPIDHNVPAGWVNGGPAVAETRWRAFLSRRLSVYSEDRNEPEKDGASGLSPYLHFGHISAHQIFHDLAEAESWNEQKLALRPTGSRAGWWRMSRAAEEFLDQMVTWREVGLNSAAHRPGNEAYESLPEWSQVTLRKHSRDAREHRYSLEEFESARTHDPLWNAAQTQLVREGRVHNYLRMLWGKKIIEWTKTPEQALAVMVELNNKFALDGRDPNSYSGIFWCLGRYDRPWGPERAIFGKIRYMSSENTARKYRVKSYIARYAPETS
jgi:deoxyribodipyrimidine photo-lyase